MDKRLEQLKKMGEDRNVRLAVAESITCGLVQSLLGGVKDISHIFVGGVTAYTLQSKVAMLGIDGCHAEKYDCISRKVAEQMARGVACAFGANLSVATTGYANRTRGVPYAFCCAWYLPASGPVVIRRSKVVGKSLNRVEMQQKVASKAIDLLIACMAATKPSARQRPSAD